MNLFKRLLSPSGPIKDKRPEERWSAGRKREKAVAAISQRPEEKAFEEIQTKSVGVTSLAAAILDQSGMMEDVLDMMDGDVKEARRLLNVALGAAITARPT